jgi:hypothetical protein
MSDLTKQTTKILDVLKKTGMPDKYYDIVYSALQTAYISGRSEGLNMAIKIIKKRYQKYGK